MLKYILICLTSLISLNVFAADFSAADKLKIIEVAGSVGPLADLRDWCALKKLFTPKFDFDESSYVPGLVYKDYSIDDFVDKLLAPVFSKFEFTHHAITSPRVTKIGPNKANVRSHLSAIHRCAADVPNRQWADFGDYNLDLVKVDGEWKITSYTYHHRRTEGVENVPCK